MAERDSGAKALPDLLIEGVASESPALILDGMPVSLECGERVLVPASRLVSLSVRFIPKVKRRKWGHDDAG